VIRATVLLLILSKLYSNVSITLCWWLFIFLFCNTIPWQT